MESQGISFLNVSGNQLPWLSDLPIPSAEDIS